MVNGERRKSRTLRATDEEWEVLKTIASLLKDGGEEARILKKMASK